MRAVVLQLRMSVLTIMLAFSAALTHTLAYGDPATLAWLDGGQVRVQTLGIALTSTTPQVSAPITAESLMPLGSLWKLFVYAYAVDQGLNEPDYHCKSSTHSANERAYCCLPGGSVDRNTALVRSCSPYFDPQRLHISAADWRAYWQQFTDADSQWLTVLNHMKPNYRLTVREILHALHQIPVEPRDTARQALIQLSLSGFARDALPTLGTFARMKTYTWADAATQGKYLGGAAGWLPQGTPFWLMGEGSSQQVLTRYAQPLAAALITIEKVGVQSAFRDEPCVNVRFFNRYPLQSVTTLQGNTVPAGAIQQPVQLIFSNGQRLTLHPHGEIMLQRTGNGPPVIHGRFSLNAYVARVIEREGGNIHVAAAQALGVLARTYILQNGQSYGGCYHIADDSRYQRVSANTPAIAALRAAWFTDGLMLSGRAVHYHQSRAGPDVMSVTNADHLAQHGALFTDILQAAFPQAHFSGLNGMEDCTRLPIAEAWLKRMQPRWIPLTAQAPGFEAPSAVQVCEIAYGHPYSDQRRLRIYTHAGQSYQSRLALAHEYLHLGFRFHPQGIDEAYIERWARKLIDG